MKKNILFLISLLLIYKNAIAQDEVDPIIREPVISKENPRNTPNTGITDEKRKKIDDLSSEKKQLIKNEQILHNENIKKIIGTKDLSLENDLNKDSKIRDKNRRNIINNLNPQSKNLLNKENERHRNEIIKITGKDYSKINPVNKLPKFKKKYRKKIQKKLDKKL